MKKTIIVTLLIFASNIYAAEVFNATAVSSIVSGCVAISGCKQAEAQSAAVIADLEEYNLTGNLSVLLQQKISDLQKTENISSEEALELIIEETIN